MHENDPSIFDEASRALVDLANRMAEQHPDADLRELAGGLLSGAVHYWLYAHQPCGAPNCEDCAELATAELRRTLLLSEAREFAETSEYYHSPNDSNVGRA